MAAKDSGLTEKQRKEVIDRANKRREYLFRVDRENRKQQRDDTSFVYIPGAQWSDAAKTDRNTGKDPVMEFPQLRQFVSQVVNQQRQGRPGIRVHPASGDASDKSAELLQGLMRGIEYESRAEAVYDDGYRNSVVGGRGYWRIVSEYESEESFNQVLRIKAIPDPLAVWMDPDFQEPDGGDRQYVFVDEQIPKELYREKWPKAKGLSIDAQEWWKADQDDHVLICDYYERTASDDELLMLVDGSVVYASDAPKGVQVVSRRPVLRHAVSWYTIGGGDEILATHTWKGSIIPVVCAMGEEVIVDGVRRYFGLITPSKDAQRLFNYGMSQQALHLMSSPRQPFVGPVEATEGFEGLWKNANSQNIAYLPYRAYDDEGRQLPAPQRQPGATPDSGWINWTQQMTGLIRATIGMYQASLGMTSNETSGRAINAREQQSDNATFHFQDNLSRAIGLTGRILLENIPIYYDTARVVSAVKPDDTVVKEEINKVLPNPDDPTQPQVVNDVKSGKYSVTVEAGPTYATKRQETADLIMGMVQAYPPLMQFAGDLVMKAQDVPDADQFAKRLKLMLPPPVLQSIQAEEHGQPEPDPQMMAQLQQMQQQMQQMGEQMQMVQAENQQLKAGVAEKQAVVQADAQVKMQANKTDATVRQEAAQLDAQVTLRAAEIKANADAEAKVRTKLIDAAAEIFAASLQPQPVPGADGADGDDVAQVPPMDMATIVAGLQETMAALAQSLLAPRQMTVQTDAAGNVIGGVSEVVPPAGAAIN